MTLALDTPASPDNPLRRLDARWKIAAVAVAVVGDAFLANPEAILGGVAVAFVLAIDSKALQRTLVPRLLPIVGMLILLFGWSIFSPKPGEEPWTILGVSVSPTATLALAAVVGKTIAIVTLVVTLLDSAPLYELAEGAAGLGVPRLFVHLVLLTHRYIFVLGEEFSRLRRALRVRGFRSRINRRTFATIGNVAGSLFVRGHERAERVHHAMAARGFDGVFRSMATPRTQRIDILVFGVMSFITAILFVLDRGWLPL